MADDSKAKKGDPEKEKPKPVKPHPGQPTNYSQQAPKENRRDNDRDKKRSKRS